jgi:ubiquitin carboxyl-terminal hydrolase L3
MSSLALSLGVSPALSFHDVYSLSPDALAFLPRPVYALLFLCPATIYHRARDAEHAAMPTYTGSGPAEPVLWFKQTIGHACGLIALLHGLANGGAKAYITPDSTLDKLLQEVVNLKPEERAQLLYDSAALEAAHMAAAVRGDTVAPDAREENYQHFICFVKGRDGHLWELNGGMKGPVDRGVLVEEEDALSEKALGLGVRTFLDLVGEGGEGDAEGEGKGDINFSLVAMAPGFD